MSNAESAVERHDRMVREEREQAERVRSDGGGEPDMWRPHAHRFGGGRHEAEHPAVPALIELSEPEWHVIDVGAGGGRITLPVASAVREVTAVEPSPSMREVLETRMRAEGIANLRVVAEPWEEADVLPAEFVFAANVTYGIQEIEPFLRKMDEVATRRVALVTFVDPPQQRIAPFWRYVYGEERLRLPCRDELLDVLRELGAQPRLYPLPAHQPQPFGPREAARDEVRRRLFVGTGSPLMERIDEALDELTEERWGELWLREDQPNERCIVWWEPGAFE